MQVTACGGVVGETLGEGPEEMAAVGGGDGGGVAGFCCVNERWYIEYAWVDYLLFRSIFN